MTDKEILDAIHTNIHALRLQNGYKPSAFEMRINKLIAEHYAFGCKKCEERVLKYKYQSEPTGNSDGFLAKVGKWANQVSKNAEGIE